MKLKVSTKIALSYCLLMSFVLMIVATSFFNLTATKTSLEEVEKANQRLVLALQAQNAYTESLKGIRGYIAYGEDKYYEETDKFLKLTIELEKQYLAYETNPERGQQLLDTTTELANLIMTTEMDALKESYKAAAAGNQLLAQELRQKGLDYASSFMGPAIVLTETLSEIVQDNKEIIETDLAMTQDRADRVLTTSLIIGIAAIFAGSILTFIFVRLIRKPINIMLAGANRFAEGDLTDTIHIKSNDEFALLAKALNNMRDNFKNIIQNIYTTTELVAASSEQLSASAEESAAASAQVADAISEVASGSENQSRSVQETSMAIEQIAAGIQQAAHGSNSVVDLTNHTTQATIDGQTAIDKVVGQMDSIGKVTHHVHETINKLAVSSNQIGEIINVISDIAAQTNLLALNAAIEAARAGEQGRGFAVVAEEVRKLAEQSSDAARQITSLINDNQANINNAVNAIGDGSKDVKAGIELVGNAGEAFNEIANRINQVASEIHEISASIQQASGNSEQIVTSIREIDRLSKMSAEQAELASSATESQTASVEQIASSSHSLAQMSQELRLVVEKFKI